ncbi:triose-phosphate isomerase [Eionea flava]
MRHPLVIGNWKMNGSAGANGQLLNALMEQFSAAEVDAHCVICAPFVYIAQLREFAGVSSVLQVGAQDVSVHLNGAYTGEISASMLADMGCSHVIIGHSERREYHQESSLLVAQKALALLQHNLTPVICVGETLEQRQSEQAFSVIGEQLLAVKNVLGDKGLSRCVIAYEPVWAIGTGLTATPEQAQAVHQFIREQLGDAANSVSVLYGGSVKPDNAKTLFEQPDIDGALVGGASLKAKDFFDIVSAF